MDSQNNNSRLPLIPLRDIVVFPNMVAPLFVGRDKSVKALESAMNADKNIILVTQKKSSIDEPQSDDIYEIGTLGKILQLLRLPDGTVKALIEGGKRVAIKDFKINDEYIEASYKVLSDEEKIDNIEVDKKLVTRINRFNINDMNNLIKSRRLINKLLKIYAG